MACTLHPIQKGPNIQLSTDLLTLTKATATGAYEGVLATVAHAKGKWYFEVNVISTVSYACIGVAPTETNLSSMAGDNTRAYMSNGQKVMGNTNTKFTGGIAWTNGDTVGIAVDIEGGKFTVYHNGALIGDAFTDISSLSRPLFACIYSYSGGFQATAKFDGGFKYTPPTGYLPWGTDDIKLCSTLVEMEIGDIIPCKYYAGSGAAGVFSEMGTSVAAGISLSGTATPSGKFWFIKVDKGLCIADRVIQHTVTWDTLNAAGYNDGKPYIQTTIPVMTSNSQNGYVLRSSKAPYGAGYELYKAFDGDDVTRWLPANGDVENWIEVEYPTPIIINAIQLHDVNTGGNGAPSAIEIFGYNDSFANAVSLGVFRELDPVARWETRLFSNKTAYKVYRIKTLAYTNTSYYGQISSLALANVAGIIRMPSGGVSFIDANGASSLTDKSLGAFPPLNEWDRYVVKSNLNGRITAGDDTIWHWKDSFGTFCQEIPLAGVVCPNVTIPAYTTSLSYVTLRGMLKGYGTTVSTINAALYSTTSGLCGFRPVLEFAEPSVKASTLWY